MEATLCDTCAKLRPCLDGAWDWDDCTDLHDIGDQKRMDCDDYCVRDDLITPGYGGSRKSAS